jgi:hypothetical protein
MLVSIATIRRGVPAGSPSPAAGAIASSSGSPTTTPVPRKNARRDNDRPAIDVNVLLLMSVLEVVTGENR